MFTSQLISKMVDWTVALVEAILGLRIILKLFGANPATPFVRWVYDASQPLLEPFSGIFTARRLGDGSFLEFTAIFALIIYALAGMLLQEFILNLAEAAEERD